MNTLTNLIKSLNGFQYYANFGNLGDLLIAEGTRQYFRRNSITYHEYNEQTLPEKFDLVYAGGARFTSCWCNTEECKKILTDRRIKTCVILPHSFYEVDELLLSLDQRHHLFCRDKKSYDYCLSLKLKSNVYLSSDMAFNLNLAEDLETFPPHKLNEEEEETKKQIESGLLQSIQRGVSKSIVYALLNKEQKKIAFLLRADKEKASSHSTLLTYDISTAWHTSGKNMAYNKVILNTFSNAIRQADVIVSDRLHVCIMAYLSGVEVYLLDNKYNKLSGVYHQSLADKPNVHLLPDGQLSEELDIAWKKFNSPLRVLKYKLTSAISWCMRLPSRMNDYIKRKNCKIN